MASILQQFQLIYACYCCLGGPEDFVAVGGTEAEGEGKEAAVSRVHCGSEVESTKGPN